MARLRTVWRVAWRVLLVALVITSIIEIIEDPGYRTVLASILVLSSMLYAYVWGSLRECGWPYTGRARGMITVGWVQTVWYVGVMFVIPEVWRIADPGRPLVVLVYVAWSALLLWAGIHDWLRLQFLQRTGAVKPARARQERE